MFSRVRGLTRLGLVLKPEKYFSTSAPVAALKKNITLELEDGTKTEGKSFGAPKSMSGEVVFSTGMVGYVESLTDPSYKDQILVLTQPLIGNYGVPCDKETDQFGILKNMESSKIHVSGVVVRNYSQDYSHKTAVKSLSNWLKQHDIPAITEVDTREITKIIRNSKGPLLGKLQYEESETIDIPKNTLDDGYEKKMKKQWKLFDQVSRKTPEVFNAGGDVKIMAVDCGIKNNIIRKLCEEGAEVTVVPHDYNIIDNIKDFHALFLSNGPGDPKYANHIVSQVKAIVDNETNPFPIFGICMGNQILAQAAGMETYPLDFGNRGHNQPVFNTITGECIVTSQNHGYAVDEKKMKHGWKPLYTNTNDWTNEGIYHETLPYYSVQFHPEACGGPTDAGFLFTQFVNGVRKYKNNKQVLDIFDFGKHQRLHEDQVAKNNGYIPTVDASEKRLDHGIKTVLVLGSGGLQIGQAGEFDYSGSQAIKALKEENIRTILINPNIATIQTGDSEADVVYFLPITPEYIEQVMEKEPDIDGCLLTFGGQTALNVGIQLHDAGTFEKYGVKVLGTPISTLVKSEDRDLFSTALLEIDEPAARSTAVNSVEDALAAAEVIGYPVMVRSAFCLGGLGSGICENEEEMKTLCSTSLSLAPQVLVERSMKGWKEVEYEIVRDGNDNCIAVCNMENFDPLGTHTGDSIVVAPSQTLTDYEYHKLRTASINIVRHLGVVGECNVQFALDPETSNYCVIEMNARLSRSSALASKATGYPLAFVAAKLSLGYTLPDVKNSITKSTTAFFEPSLDYVVCKVPRWDLSKFDYVNENIGSAMKSVGEVMAIAGTFEESFQKALRMADTQNPGFAKRQYKGDMKTIIETPTPERVFALAEAMYDGHLSVDEIHDMSKIDKWFLYKLKNIVDTSAELKNASPDSLPVDTLREAKKQGFSDIQIADCLNSSTRTISDLYVRSYRKEKGIVPVVKQIDTLAGEYPAQTNYLYTTYNGSFSDIKQESKDDAKDAVMVLGSGVYRIGSSVEFDWCNVNTSRTLRDLNFKTVVVNYNPETVSTDYDECDSLYFEELSVERVMDIYELESSKGVITSVGGQQPQNILNKLYENGLNILGTHPKMIDMAEDRSKFSNLLDRLAIDQPRWTKSTTLKDAEDFADRVSYPVLIRPSYVLSGAAMNVAYNKKELEEYLSLASDVSSEHPVVITKFMENSKEYDIDGVAVDGELVTYAISEHIENAGTHSGDASLILPPTGISNSVMAKLEIVANKVALGLNITGPFNMQVIHDPKDDNSLKVIECNLRASRSFPFVSKTLGVNFIKLSTQGIISQAFRTINKPDKEELMSKDFGYHAVKVPQFSFTRLAGADPKLGVEMASTGEVACFGLTATEAYLKSLQSVHGFDLPKENVLILTNNTNKNGLTAEQEYVYSELSGLKYNVQVLNLVHGDPKLDGYDLNAAKELLTANKTELVIDMSTESGARSQTPLYFARRASANQGLSLINNIQCAIMFTEGIKERASMLAKEKGKMETVLNNITFSAKSYTCPKSYRHQFHPHILTSNLG